MEGSQRQGRLLREYHAGPEAVSVAQQSIGPSKFGQGEYTEYSRVQTVLSSATPGHRATDTHGLMDATSHRSPGVRRRQLFLTVRHQTIREPCHPETGRP